jgi:ligand-binding sensor domain-containing protein/class 3 adenylate cyclase
MWPIRKATISCLVLVTLVGLLSAQSEAFVFSRLDQDKGLPGSAVHTMLVDKKGFAWLGMQDGLVRWDGRHFLRLETVKDDTTSLPCTFVKALLEDPDGTIWVATIGGGLCRFDPVTRRFKRYPFLKNDPHSLSDPNAFSLFLDSKNDLWVGVYNSGLNRFNRKTNNFERYALARDLNNELEAFQRNTVRDITEDKANPDILWLATNEGIARFEKKGGAIQHFYFPAREMSGVYAHSVFMDTPGYLWVGTNGAGLARFDTRTLEWQHFVPNPVAWAKRSTLNNIILDLLPKSENELWVCSPDMGLGVFNRQSHTFLFVKNDPETPVSVAANLANVIHQDREGRIWVGHLNKGVSILDPEGPTFTSRHLTAGNCVSVEADQTSSFEYDPTRSCYFVAKYACDGLFMLDENKNFLKKIPVADRKGQFNAYQCVKRGRQGRIWVGGMGQVGDIKDAHPLKVLLPGANQLVPFAHKHLPNRSYNIYHIHEDKLGNLWLATDYLGLMHIDFQRDTIEYLVKSAAYPQAPSEYVHVKQIMEDPKGRLWMATQGEGVFCFDPQTRLFRQWLHLKTGYNGLVETRVNALVPDEKGLVWLATSGNGIQVLDPQNQTDPIVAQWAGPEGLPSPRINNLARDTAGNMWVCTEGGLCYYEAKTQKITVYGKQDGIANNDFYEQGLKIFPNGEVFIGHDKGFYFTDPQKYTQKEQHLKMAFSAFKIFEQERFFDKDLNYLSQITLRPNENYFSIAFSDLRFARPKTSLLAWQLEGYDKDWIYPKDDRSTAAYTNVPPGHYTFRLRRIDGEANNEDLFFISLNINILPPWWHTWWAYLLYCILISILIYTVYSFLKKRIILQNQLKLEYQESTRLRERTIELANEKKEVERQKARSEELLLNILPEEVAKELKATGTAEAQLIDEVTVLFCDFKDFTQLSENLSPQELVAEIHACFSAFDLIVQRHGVEKIKTVGDAYMAAGGLPIPNKTHAADVVNAALEMRNFMEHRQRKRQASEKFFFEARLGVHTGPVIAGIVGIKKFAYDIWGDTVNTASRIESCGEPGKVNISDITKMLLTKEFQCTYRGKINAKGKGEIDMYFVEKL